MRPGVMRASPNARAKSSAPPIAGGFRTFLRDDWAENDDAGMFNDDQAYSDADIARAMKVCGRTVANWKASGVLPPPDVIVPHPKRPQERRSGRLLNAVFGCKQPEAAA